MKNLMFILSLKNNGFSTDTHERHFSNHLRCAFGVTEMSLAHREWYMKKKN